MAARQRRLAGMVFAMDKKAKLAEIARAGRDAVNDPAFVNHLGQAAMLQAHVQFLVEAQSQSTWAAATGYVPVRSDAVELEPLATKYANDPRFAVAYEGGR